MQPIPAVTKYNLTDQVRQLVHQHCSPQTVSARHQQVQGRQASWWHPQRHPASAGDCTIGAAVWLCVLSGVSGRYVQYLNFLQDLEQLVMAAQDAQVGSRCRTSCTCKAVHMV